MDKTISVRGNDVTFSIWDLGGTSFIMSHISIRTTTIYKDASFSL